MYSIGVENMRLAFGGDVFSLNDCVTVPCNIAIVARALTPECGGATADS